VAGLEKPGAAVKSRYILLPFNGQKEGFGESRRPIMSTSNVAYDLPRRAARLFFRHHIENGISVGLCMAAVGIGFWVGMGVEASVLAATGAFCVSIVDQPGPLAGKAPVFLAAIVASGAVSFLAGFAGGHVWALGAVVAAMSIGVGLASAYGRAALMLGIAGVLSLVLGMAIPAGNTAAVIRNGTLFVAGSVAYAILALAAALLFDDRNRRMFLNEALLAFASYLAARAVLYDSATPIPAALRELIEAHGMLMERLQAARNAIFTGRQTHRRRRWIAAMLALLDAYEAVLAGDADWEILRREAGAEVLAEIAALIRANAAETEAVGLALVAPSAGASSSADRAAASRLAELDAALARLRQAGETEQAASLSATRDKLAETIRRLARLGEIVAGSGAGAATLPDVDLAAFVQVQDTRVAILRSHLNLSSPVMRYTIRFTLAMLAGYAVTVALPHYVHGGWILLTVALIMRASYAVTVQRRNDRILGTLLGCAAAAVAIPILPAPALLALMVIAVGVAHAYLISNYRVTSFAASLMALLLLHFLEPPGILLIERVVDTLIGAGLSILFSYLLPSWEWKDIPGLMTKLLDADRNFAVEALAPVPEEQKYRLARKRALDAFTTAATTTRRLSSEPGARPRQMASLNALLAANYLFASDIASVRTLMRLRGKEIDPAAAREQLGAARGRVLEALGSVGTAPPLPGRLRRRALTEIHAADAVAFLTRRLGHIEYAARRLAALADRARHPEENGEEASDSRKIDPI
jgi:uncharacterized membrane protein YccC